MERVSGYAVLVDGWGLLGIYTSYYSNIRLTKYFLREVKGLLKACLCAGKGRRGEEGVSHAW